ncbi:MAG: NAD-dependent epimerase/dehydratase [Micavibrio sp.]|nr:NAD-dependent epimerase/dehydratase [Micavibrio sp.]
MTLPYKTATVFGGTGFIGRYVVRELARLGYRVKVATRMPESAYFVRLYGTVGQIVPFQTNLRDAASIDAAVSGSEVVVNCVGILYQNRRSKFHRLHAEVPSMIAASCAKFGVARFVHLSAMGVDKALSQSGKTKLEGEKKVFEHFPAATILRPSAVFGPEDRFFNLFASLAQKLPVLPLVGGGRMKFQPVYVGDVAAAVIASVVRTDTSGGIYELGGPEVMSLRDVYNYVFKATGRTRALMPLPFALAKVEAFFLQMVPGCPLLTTDQVESLKTDNVASPYALGLADLGVGTTGMELIVPGYLERFRSGGRFAETRAAA